MTLILHVHHLLPPKHYLIPAVLETILHKCYFRGWPPEHRWRRNVQFHLEEKRWDRQLNCWLPQCLPWLFLPFPTRATLQASFPDSWPCKIPNERNMSLLNRKFQFPPTWEANEEEEEEDVYNSRHVSSMKWYQRSPPTWVRTFEVGKEIDEMFGFEDRKVGDDGINLRSCHLIKNQTNPSSWKPWEGEGTMNSLFL